MTYEEACAAHSWQVPERYNIAADVCDKHPRDKLAMIHEDPDGTVREVAWGELQDMANRFALRLLEAGVQKGDRVAMLLPPTPETAAAFFGTWKVGGILLSMSILYGDDGIRHRLNDSQAKVVVTNRANRSRVEDQGADVLELEPGDLDSGSTDHETLDTSCDDPAQLYYTSGTTGLAKGILHAHRYILGHEEFVYCHDVQDGERFHGMGEWAWAAGIAPLLGPWRFGAVQVVLQRKGGFDPHGQLAFLSRHRPTNVFATPTAIRSMMGIGDAGTRYPQDFRIVCSAGEPLNPEAIRWFREQYGVTVLDYYGLSESYPLVANYPFMEVREGSMGRPMPGWDVKILDEDEQPVATDERGEICLRARSNPHYPLGYWNNEAAGHETFGGEWFHTKDAASQDADGYIWYEGRADDVIISAGYRIGPFEVESACLEHPAVAEAAAVAWPDERRGNVVKAFVVIAAGHEPSDELGKEISAFVREHLSAYAYPRIVEFVDDLPKTLTGKIRRIELREEQNVSVDAKSHEALSKRLEELLEVETFPPPEEFARDALFSDPAIYQEAADDRMAWWEKQARELDWFSEWDTTLDDSDPPFFKWFTGGTINASYNCLDRHVEAGNGDRVAFYWRGEEGEERELTYADLLRDVKRFANALKAQGVQQGDVVGIYLPMIPAVIVAMLACARIGAPHNVVFGGFSAESVKERMEVSEAKVLITADGARRKGKVAAVKQACDEVGMPVQTTIVVRHTGIDCPMGEGDVFYDELLDAADDECEAEALDAEHPLYILYSSGSTAKPKGIQHTTGGYLTCVAWTHKAVFDLKPESDVYFCSADVGWVTGHSYIVYGPLMNGATSVMYEGAPDYPDKDIWWELCERYGVTLFYTAPTAIRACMKWGEEYPGRHDLSKLRLLGSVGEPINPKAWVWYYHVIGGERCPVVDTWWQTETGAIMIAPLPGITHCKPGSATHPLPGVVAAVVGEDGEELPRDRQGLLTLQEPWPSMLRTLYGDDDRYVSTYFEKFGPETYFVGDASRQDEDHYFWVIGRVDDVLNVSGHRMSTAEIESAVVSHPKVAECATIGAADEDTGQTVVCFVTLEGDLEGTDELVAEIREHVAKKIGKLARPKRIVWADDLPKTRSGKIMRRLLRDIAEGRELGDVTTLRDPAVMSQLEEKIAERRDEE